MGSAEVSVPCLGKVFTMCAHAVKVPQVGKDTLLMGLIDLSQHVHTQQSGIQRG